MWPLVAAQTFLALAVMGVFATPVGAQQVFATEYVTVRLPHGVRLQMPRNWRILTEDARITLNAATEALLSTIDAERLPSTLPFAANYYDGARVTAGILNVRYYPESISTQTDVRSLGTLGVQEVDSQLRGELTASIAASGNRLLAWMGTVTQDIDGMRFLITEYRRTSPTGRTFLVRLIRMLNANRSFTVTLSYREDERVLIPIVNYMTQSLKIERAER